MPSHTSLGRAPRAALLAAFALSANLSCVAPSAAQTPDVPAIQALRSQIDAMRQEYEMRLQALEAKLQQALATAQATAPQTASADIAEKRSKDNRFNPAVSLVLSGTYSNLSKDPQSWQLTGFIPGGEELGPGARGFSLAESELSLSANIDSWLFGSLTVAITPEDSIETEEAFIQSTALPGGLTLKAGRFFGALGYLNEQHAHSWDFVDAPLAYQAFLGGQYKQDGLQAKWLLPTEQFVALSAELGQGANFPGHDRQHNGLGALALAMHTGGDVGTSHHWRAGVSWLQTKAKARPWEVEADAFDQAVVNTFTGRSRTWVIDGVWKWAPQGNARRRNFKLQGEYFHRTETGDLSYDMENASAGMSMDSYRSTQSGWYLQGIYQFAPGWRMGLRHDQLDVGKTDLASNADHLPRADHSPRRHSVMLDWGPSEFQRWRLQLSHDLVRAGEKDTQLFLQYQVNLGAHGAHNF